MKFLFCVIYTLFWFMFTMIREAFLWLIFRRTFEGVINNIMLLIEGELEFLEVISKYDDIPFEVTFKYLNALFETAY